jgi:hypothetical protein
MVSQKDDLRCLERRIQKGQLDIILGHRTGSFSKVLWITEVHDLVSRLCGTAWVFVEDSPFEKAGAVSVTILRLPVRAEVVKFDILEDGASIGIMLGTKDARKAWFERLVPL